MQQLDRHSVGSSLNNVHPVKRKRKVRANIILHIRRERPSERNGTTKQNPPKNVSDNWNSRRKIKEGGRRKKSWSDDPCTIPTRPKYILLERPPKEEKKKSKRSQSEMNSLYPCKAIYEFVGITTNRKYIYDELDVHTHFFFLRFTWTQWPNISR